MQRNNTIDTFRGLSILTVILLHCKIHMSHAFGLPKAIFHAILSNGSYGVTLFFVISGYLITSTSLQRFGSLRNIDPKKFYIYRFARIMPCLLLLIAVLSILNFFKLPGFTIENTNLSQAIFSALTFHLNYLESKVSYLPANWDVLWSLSIEEMFYLFFPLVCLFIRPRYSIGILLFFIIIGPFARTILSTNEIWQDYSYLSNLDGIAIGCLVALAPKQLKFWGKNLAALGFCMILLIMVFRNWTFDLGLTKTGLNVSVLEWGMGLILVSLGSEQYKSSSVWTAVFKPLRWLGRNSYEIYLIHSFFVITATEYWYQANRSAEEVALMYGLIIMMSGLLGQVLAWAFSEPLNKLIRTYRISSKLPSTLTTDPNKI